MSDFHLLQYIVPSTKYELVSDTISVAAVTSPGWLPYLRAASEEASLLLPLAGLLLVVINVIARILITRKTLKK